MANTLLQAEIFVKDINQQLEILKEEKKTVTDAIDHRINQVQSEVNAWINGGIVSQTTYTEMYNRIQEILSLFLEKSAEISGKQIHEIESYLNKATTNNFVRPVVGLKRHEIKTEPLLESCETGQDLGPALRSDDSHNMTMRFAILEEAVYSLKNTTDKVGGKIENVDKILNDVSTQQVNDQKKVEILTTAKLKTKKKLNNKITDLEKRYEDIKSNFNDLFDSVTNSDANLNKLEEENKYVKVTINELNEQISSVRACSNDALMSIQDLSKSVESTNQYYIEMSNKMDQLEISVNLMSSQYTEQFENMSSLNKDKTDDLIGMVCQLLAKRLIPMEKLNEALNKKVKSVDNKVSKKSNPGGSKKAGFKRKRASKGAKKKAKVDKDDDDSKDDSSDDDEDEKEDEEEEEPESEDEPPKKAKAEPKKKPANKNTKENGEKDKLKKETKKRAPMNETAAESWIILSDSLSADSDNESCAKNFTKSPPSNEELKELVNNILDGADLDKVTMKTVVKQVHAKYPSFDLSDREKFIKDTVIEVIS